MAQEARKMEVKERFSPEQFKQILQQWAEAASRDQDFAITLRGNSFSIPASALSHGRLEIEYEINKGEHEFEMSVTWR